MKPQVSIVIMGYNALPHFEACLESIFKQDFKDFEVIWVDSASSDGSLQRIRARFPQTKIIALPTNAGYRSATNIGAREAKGEYLVVCNQDTKMDRACLAQMVASIEYDPTAGIVAPKILMFDSPELMNEAGNTMHYTGLYRSRGLGAPATDFSISEPIATMSGCCFLIRRDLWMKLEGFSEDFDQFDTGWHACFEDVDLAWRAQLAGFKVMFCPQALMFHKYESKGMVSQRFCGHEWGRYLVFLRNYEFKTLFLLFPLMVILELGTWFYAIGKGRPWLMAKVRVMGWFATNMTHLNRMRERVQRTRRVQDIAIVRQMSHTIPVTHVMKSTGLTRTMQRAMDILFEKYYYFLLGSLTVLHRFDQGATDDCKVGQSRG